MQRIRRVRRIRVVLGSLCFASAAGAQAPSHSQLDDSSNVEASSERGAASTNRRESASLETTSLSDDLLGAPGHRSIRGDRVEALVSTGSYGTRRGVARATTRQGDLGLELTGSFTDGEGYAPIAADDRGAIDGRAARLHQGAGLRLDHEHGRSDARAFATISDDTRSSGTAYQGSAAATTLYGGRWRVSGDALHLDLELFGEQARIDERRALVGDDRSTASLGASYTMPLSTHGARASLGSRRVRALGVDHEIEVGGGLVLASGETTGDLTPSLGQKHMTTVIGRKRVHGDHRFLDAYIEDTVRFIRTLDVSGGLVIERWSNLGGDSTIAYGLDDPMEVDTPDVSHLLVSPSLGALHRIDDRVAVRVRTARNLRAPTMTELYRSEWVGDRTTTANPDLRPETVWTTQAGPEVTAGRLVARAAMFYSSIGHTVAIVDGQRTNVGASHLVGLDTEASYRPTSRLLATVSYTFAASRITESGVAPHLVGNELALAPRQRGAAQLSYDAQRFATLTGGVRLIGASFEDDRNTRRLGGYAVVDALAARKLTGGLTGFVGIDNALDRRYAVARTGADVLGAPRMFHVGLRLDSDRF